MNLIPALIGSGAALAFGGVLIAIGAAGSRAAALIALIAIAAFYPVFAFDAPDWGGRIAHLAGLAIFAAAGVVCFRRKPAWLALIIIIHGVFDLLVGHESANAPDWWPPFCAAFDVTFGLILYWAWRREPDL